MLQATAVSRPLPELHIGKQTENRAAPVGASPGAGMVETTVARSGLTLWHVMHYVRPNSRRAETPGLGTRDRLHVGSEALLDPMVLPRHQGKSQVYKFMGHGPVMLQLPGAGVLTDGDLRSRWRTVCDGT